MVLSEVLSASRRCLGPPQLSHRWSIAAASSSDTCSSKNSPVILGRLAILFVRSPSAAPPFNDAVSNRMTAVVITTSEDERVHVAMEKMTNGWFRHLPVIRHANLIGLVSIGDLVKAPTRRVRI
jgi:hypothetical protein